MDRGLASVPTGKIRLSLYRSQKLSACLIVNVMTDGQSKTSNVSLFSSKFSISAGSSSVRRLKVGLGLYLGLNVIATDALYKYQNFLEPSQPNVGQIMNSMQ